ncbi:MAG: Na(+)-translocating NADH-quinone reductase subunit A [Flavobacteriaceae bacterium]|nr:Na(+)-translocating NADH-quinone reductase subunit A [Flavobacteriaceae bacterium]
MSTDIKIKKGLTIKLQGAASNDIETSTRSKIFTIYPTDFHGITPKLTVKVGAKLLAGDVLFYAKSNEELKFTSPVSGELTGIIRGAKRKILALTIKADAKDTYKDFGKKTPSNLTDVQIKEALLECGAWAFINQRPYDTLANPKDTPKAIFVSGFDTAPLAANTKITLQGKEDAFQVGMDALSKLTEGKIHLSVQGNSFLNTIKGVSIHNITGKHPAGNVGVQISKINPINSGDRVWTINAQDVAIIGNLFLTGNFDTTRIIALAGSEVSNPKYYQAKPGTSIADFTKDKLASDNVRIINGNPLTGKSIKMEGSLGFYNNEVTVLPEGGAYRFMGWLPFVGNHIHSVSRTSFSFLASKKEYVLNTLLNGEERAFVETGAMEKVMPIDVYPMQLLKATLVGDIDRMEKLGIYEVAPEDFALIDYTSSSKIEAQDIIRKGLDLMISEVG